MGFYSQSFGVGDWLAGRKVGLQVETVSVVGFQGGLEWLALFMVVGVAPLSMIVWVRGSICL